MPAEQLPIWRPWYRFQHRSKRGNVSERGFVVKDVAVNECPVSFLDRAPEAIHLVKFWMKGERTRKTLSKMLGDDAAWLEDVEDLLAACQDAVKDTHKAEVDKLIQLG